MAVVGEAHIIVRAITTQVKDDIKRGFSGVDGVINDEISGCMRRCVVNVTCGNPIRINLSNNEISNPLSLAKLYS